MTLAAERAPVAPCLLPATLSSGRIVPLDQMRGFLIALVVLHHAILAYCTFGQVSRFSYALSTAPIIDARRWVGFDAVVCLNDSFFMPLLFLLSGLFVRDGLVRKGAAAYLCARLLRLGLPFAVAELTIVPLAYYPSFLQAGGVADFPRFWVATVSVGPWPSGPPWFIGDLLLLDAAAGFAFAGDFHRSGSRAVSQLPGHMRGALSSACVRSSFQCSAPSSNTIGKASERRVSASLSWLEISCRGLSRTFVGDNLVRNLLPFVEASHSSLLYRRDVNEHIRAARIGLDKAETLVAVEPLHRAGSHYRSNRACVTS